MKKQSSIKDSNSLNKNVPLVPRSPVTCSPVPHQLTFEDANRKLRFAIATLQGKIEGSIWKRRLQTALICKDDLLEHGFKWQAEKIDFWIHRLQVAEKAKDQIRLQGAMRPDLSEREREESSL